MKALGATGVDLCFKAFTIIIIINHFIVIMELVFNSLQLAGGKPLTRVAPWKCLTAPPFISPLL